MIKIYGMAPHTNTETYLTFKNTKEAAEQYAHVLAGFGYTNIRLSEDGTPPPNAVPKLIPEAAPTAKADAAPDHTQV